MRNRLLTQNEYDAIIEAHNRLAQAIRPLDSTPISTPSKNTSDNKTAWEALHIMRVAQKKLLDVIENEVDTTINRENQC